MKAAEEIRLKGKSEVFQTFPGKHIEPYEYDSQP